MGRYIISRTRKSDQTHTDYKMKKGDGGDRLIGRRPRVVRLIINNINTVLYVILKCMHVIRVLTITVDIILYGSMVND